MCGRAGSDIPLTAGTPVVAGLVKVVGVGGAKGDTWHRSVRSGMPLQIISLDCTFP